MNTLLLTFVFFLIQLGTGLSILAIVPLELIRTSRLTKIQFVVLGYAIGASAVGIILGLCSVLVGDIRLHLAIMIALSAFGLAWTWPAWRPRTGDAGQIVLWCLLSLPIALATWWWTFGAFSHFPYSDLGADVHWMKTAQEYADSGVINPYASQSYIDLRSALAGVLSGTFGLDLLQFGWIYRYVSILFFLVAFYAFAQGLYAEPMRKWITFFFAAAGNSVGLLTNGSLALAGSVVFLGVLLGNAGRNVKEDIPTGAIVLLILSAATSLLIAFMLNNNALVLVLLAAGLLLLRILGKANRRESILFVGCVWPATLLLAHRGSYLFIPAVFAAWLGYLLILYETSRRPARSLGILRSLSIALPLIICGIVASIVAMRLGYLPSANANFVFSHITELVLGKKIESGEELFLGTGPEVAVIELGRAMGPLFAVCIAMAMAWWWIDRSTTASETASSPVQTVRVSRLLWSWTIGCSLTIAVLSGFPFLYRATMIVLALLTVTATEAFCQLLVDSSRASFRRRASAAITVTLLAVGLVLAVYAFTWRPDLPSARYQDFLRPTEIAGAVLLMALVPVTLIRSRWIHVCALATLVGLGIALDRAGVAGMSKSYSYGAIPSGATSITHYNASDLDAALWLHGNLNKGILLSDPYTLGLIQSLTGAPAAYVFSNLDTVNETVARPVRTIISAIVEPNGGAPRLVEACTNVRSLLQEINQETYFQMGRADALGGILRPVRPTKAPETTEPPATASQTPDGTEEADRNVIQNVLGTGQDSWQLVAVINPRTIGWIRLEAGQRLSYFPPTEPLDSGFVKSLRAGPFQTLFVNKQTAIVRIPCER
ncbi:hypothetical protein [Bradyrhizobium sp. LTSP857]|uniref:hypothetical protein n=1 Tax=Bradyrhizobium sp. LTSP857 TaxID=1619231 RepID=UPI001FD9EDE5|nr:hypothetical protein [Bradyrhizobium sp. LTSP857]